MSKLIAIVDGYSIGKYYAKKLAERGYQCLHIQSSTYVTNFYATSFCANNYINNIIHKGDINQTIAAIKQFNPCLVIAGTECGVELADTISEILNLPTNGTQYSEARRNKYLMSEALLKHSLPTMEHFASNDIDEILAWSKTHNTWPMVVKPLKSAGSDNVFICDSFEQIIHAFNTIIGTNNALGIFNNLVLIQEFIGGEEYVVNTVSQNGRHFLCDFLVYHKITNHDKNVLYNYHKPLPYSEELYNTFIPYIFSTLDALGIKHGPAHSELKLRGKQPILIETGARLMGIVEPDFMQKNIGRNQVDMSLDSYLEPEKFLREAKKPYQTIKHSLIKNLINNKKGKIRAIKHLDQIIKLPSCYKVDMHSQVGDQLGKTRNLLNSPGNIFLHHEDKENLQRDYEKILSLENDLFETDAN